MKFFIYLSLVFSFSFSQIETIKINDLTDSKEFNELKLKRTINNDFDFYQAVYADKIDNCYVIVDLGNNIIYILDENNKIIKTFAEEGEGPGRIQFISYLYIISNKYILVGNALKLSIFNSNGDFINQINLFEYKNPEIIPVEQGFLLKAQGNRQEIYKMTAKAVLREKRLTNKANYKLYNHHYKKGYHGIYYSNRPFYFNNTFIDVRVRKEFTISQFDLDFNPVRNFVFDFKAVKRNWDNFFRYKTIIKDGKAKNIKVYGKTSENIADYGNYLKDIIQIIDLSKKHIYLRISNSEVNTTKILKLNSEFNIVGKYQFKTKQIIDMKIKGNELITSQRDSEQGPFVKIYELK